MKGCLTIIAIIPLVIIGAMSYWVAYCALSVLAVLSMGINRLIGAQSTWKECMEEGAAALVDWDGTLFDEEDFQGR